MDIEIKKRIIAIIILVAFTIIFMFIGSYISWKTEIITDKTELNKGNPIFNFIYNHF